MARSVAAAAAIVAAGLSVACSIDTGEEVVLRDERRFTVADAPEVSVSTFDGAIEVRSWDHQEVLVQIERRAANAADADALEIRAGQEGSRLTIEAPAPAASRRDVVRLGSWRSPTVSFIVTVPRRVTLEARSGDGPIVARDLSGTIALRTGDGSVRGERLSGSITVDSGDGPVSIADVHGGLILETGDGSVEVSGQLDTLRISTGDGPVRLEARAGSTMKSDWTIGTGDGPITVRLPAEFDAELDAYTGDGPVAVSGITTETADAATGGVLRRRLGNGGQVLRLRTGDGPISVTR